MLKNCRRVSAGEIPLYKRAQTVYNGRRERDPRRRTNEGRPAIQKNTRHRRAHRARGAHGVLRQHPRDHPPQGHGGGVQAEAER